MRKVIAVLGLSVVLLGACGGGDDEDSNTDIASGTTTSAAASSGGGGEFGEFCAARAGFTPPATPAGGGDIKSSLEDADEALDKAASNAPSEIRADVKIVADAYKKFINAMKAANYDFTKVDTAEIQAISTPDVQAAGQRITAWAQAHCK